MGRERRRSVRIPRRFQVEYGAEDLRHRGFSKDVSVGGVFLAAASLLPIGARLHLHVLAREGEFYAEGLVVHVKRTAPILRQVEPEGMGIRFLSSSEIVQALFPRSGRSSALVVPCASAEALRSILSAQLSFGVLAVPVMGAPPPLNTVVEFDLQLSYLKEHAPIQGVGRVCQVLKHGEGPGAQVSVVLEVQDVAGIRSRLEAVAAAS